jgi:hypothetical protein
MRGTAHQYTQLKSSVLRALKLKTRKERVFADEIGNADKRLGDAIVRFCETPRTRGEIVVFIGGNVDYVSLHYIMPLLEKGRLFYTMLHILRMPHQGFVTEDGIQHIKTTRLLLDSSKPQKVP